MRKLRVLITGGPTRAYLDRVRFLSNLSTGETAYEIGKTLRQKGHAIAFVVGPSAFSFEKLKPQECVRVETNDEMQKAILRLCKSFKPDYIIFSAAVLDFAPAKFFSGKRASRKGIWNIRLVPTPKIIDQVKKRFPSIQQIGFKLEARKGIVGESLLNRMKVDFLVINFVSNLKTRYLFAHGQKRIRVNSQKSLSREINRWMITSATSNPPIC